MTAPATPPGAHLPDHPDFLWRNPEPKKSYDVVIIGAGIAGCAAAQALALADPEAPTPDGAGFLTPATALGLEVLDRFEHAGMRIRPA